MDVEGLLRRMGLTQNYRGLRETAEAVRIALAEPESLCMVTKWLYPASAKRCGTTWKSWSATSARWCGSRGTKIRSCCVKSPGAG